MTRGRQESGVWSPEFKSGVARLRREPPTLASRLHTFLYYVMPLVEGESLRDRLTRDKQLPVDEALRLTRELAMRWATPIARASSTATSSRRTCPAGAGHAVVADFGIARAVSERWGRASHRNRPFGGDTGVHEPGAGRGGSGTWTGGAISTR
jgi:hypothetical protein